MLGESKQGLTSPLLKSFRSSQIAKISAEFGKNQLRQREILTTH